MADDLKLAVFDCDGTLVDSLRSIHAAMGGAFATAGIAAPSRDAVRRIVGLPLEDAIRRLLPDAEGGRDGELAGAYRDVFSANRRELAEEDPLYPGVRDIFAAMELDGWLLGIATGKSRKGLFHVLDAHDIAGHFTTLQTSDMAEGKPNPDMLLRAMAETGVEAGQTVMIGDTSFDMRMAVNAGTHAIGVSWGYHDREELIAAGARSIIDDFKELPSALAALMGT